MYAIIETGGKQYRVEQNDVIDIERVNPTNEGVVEFTNVLFVNNGIHPKIGAPYVADALVKAEFLGETKGPKEVSFKYKQRKGIRRKVGHRQKYHRVKIIEIVG